MLDSFQQKKKALLEQISITSDSHPDLSPKGTIDNEVLPLIHLINSHPGMVTTSSCSGRLSVFLEGKKHKLTSDETKIGGKGDGGRWIYITHDLKDLENDKKVWFESIIASSSQLEISSLTSTENNIHLNKETRYILFKYEPLILHVKCRDQETANHLYSVSMACGFRETGIGPNLIVGIRISLRLDAPIAYLDVGPDGEEVIKPLVTEEYLKILTAMARNRFEENYRRRDKLYESISKLIKQEYDGTNENKKMKNVQEETKEERRERKKKEGLLRQKQLLEQEERQIQEEN